MIRTSPLLLAMLLGCASSVEPPTDEFLVVPGPSGAFYGCTLTLAAADPGSRVYAPFEDGWLMVQYQGNEAVRASLYYGTPDPFHPVDLGEAAATVEAIGSVNPTEGGLVAVNFRAEFPGDTIAMRGLASMTTGCVQ